MARSFENLVALANYHEPLREARRMVWRDKGEPVSELNDLWECVEHAAKGGMSTSPPRRDCPLCAGDHVHAKAATA
jgi:hypothetical protein